MQILKKKINNFKCIQNLKLYVFQKKWRKYNKHNKTIAMNIFPIDKVSIGKETYGDLFVRSFENENEELKIGNFCSIAPCVKFIMGGEHNYKTISTYPFKKFFFGYANEAITKGPIIVDDDVWIGYNSLILSGVHIGQGAIIGAGSIVTKDVPPYAIMAGNKIIKYRFSENIINQLMKINYSKLTIDDIKQFEDKFIMTLNESNYMEIIDSLIK